MPALGPLGIGAGPSASIARSAVMIGIAITAKPIANAKIIHHCTRARRGITRASAARGPNSGSAFDGARGIMSPAPPIGVLRGAVVSVLDVAEGLVGSLTSHGLMSKRSLVTKSVTN